MGAKSIVLSNDNEVNFWIGGKVNTEVNEDVDGQSPVTEFKGGRITGITSRCVEPGSLKDMHDILVATTEGDQDIVVELINGDKFTGVCFAVVDPDGAYSNRDAKYTFDLYTRKLAFSPL